MYGIVSKATFLFTNNASKNKIIAVINVNKVTPNPAKIFLNVKNMFIYRYTEKNYEVYHSSSLIISNISIKS